MGNVKRRQINPNFNKGFIVNIENETAIFSLLEGDRSRGSGIRESGRGILLVAARTGKISTSEISKIFPAELLRDRSKFAQAVAWLKEVCVTIKIEIKVGNPESLGWQDRQPASPRVLAEPAQERHHRRKLGEGLVSGGTSVPPDSSRPQTQDTAPETTYDEETPSQDLAPQRFQPLPDEVMQKIATIEQDLDLSDYYNAETTRPFYRQVGMYSLLDHETVIQLAKLVRESDNLEARNKLVLHNLRLVLYVARKYIGRGVDFDDLVQEGCIGLMTAAERFDYRFGYHFSTYAHWWVRQAVTRAVANMSKIVRIPVHRFELLSKIRKATAALTASLGREPTLKEIGEKIQRDPVQIRVALEALEIQPVSLDKMVYDNQDGRMSTLADFIPDPNAAEASISYAADEELTLVCYRLSRLIAYLHLVWPTSPRNVEVFRMFYGLDGTWEHDRTLEYTGKQYGVTRERIRQIAAKSWDKLNVTCGYSDHDLERDLDRIRLLEKLIGKQANLVEVTLNENEVREALTRLSEAGFYKVQAPELQGSDDEPELVAFNKIEDPVNAMVLRLVEKHTSVLIGEMLGKGKTQREVRGRWIVMFLLREDFTRAATEIAVLFGKNDHGPVWHGHKEINESLASDQELASLVEKIRAEYTLDPYPDVKSIGLNQIKLFPGQRSKAEEMLASARRKIELFSKAIDLYDGPERSKTIFRQRYGLIPNIASVQTLEKVANGWGISRERIRQILSDVWAHMVRQRLDIKSSEDFMAQSEQIEILEKLLN
ncbi:MAG: sigma-70 family RNA polymerase sigma factor [Patescibacteria group bacterium]|nr:sigma-70 family RNA polymerase sigma factor [Patescibacteria group bacterium]MDE2116577.1 sigma-70 family RNA polymerase sigma factor [Patescibacteria group bacterium]